MNFFTELFIFIKKQASASLFGGLMLFALITSKKMVSAENAENPQKFLERVHSFLSEWKGKDETILMVCHAGVGRVIETIRQGGDPELFYDLPAYKNAEVIKLDWLELV